VDTGGTGADGKLSPQLTVSENTFVCGETQTDLKMKKLRNIMVVGACR
jgi:hypothetical protein